MMAGREEPDYGNRVSSRMVYGPALAGLIFLLLAGYFWPAGLLAALCFLPAIYFAWARYLFSAEGGDVQSRIVGLVLEKLEWQGTGKALDIGCGNGALAIRLAQQYPKAQVTGVDTWGRGWGYSQSACEKNAELAGVAGRTVFEKAGTAALPYKDETFDAVVSNLTFHEVRNASDKREVVREALRVLKKGGSFAFQDLFLVKQDYGDPADLLKTVESWGIGKVEFTVTRDSPFIPRWLKLPFMVGTMGILTGKK